MNSWAAQNAPDCCARCANPTSLDVFALAEALQKTEQVLVVQWLQQWCYDLSSMKLAGRLRYHPGEEAAIRQSGRAV